jgi:hypothetical protein
MNELIIFAGPSITSDLIKRFAANAQIRPPVQLGDLCQFSADSAATVVILDGYFSQVPAVWHKEIMLALSQGCRVIGAASMGALRAAELADFGMEGVGWVFEQYRRGDLQDDDEVALVHADAALGYRPLSLALVNLRYLLTTGLCPEPLQSLLSWLICALKSEFYPRRTLERCQLLLQSQQVDQQLTTELLSILQQPQWQIKQQDALNAIWVAQQPNTAICAAASPESTVFLQQIVAQKSRLEPLNDRQLLARLLSILADAKPAIPTVTHSLIQQQFCLWCRQRALHDNSAVLAWLQQHDLKSADLQQFLQLMAGLSTVENSQKSSTFYALLQEIYV